MPSNDLYPGAQVNNALADAYQYEPQHDALAALHDASPDLYATLPAAVRASNAEYLRRRMAAQGAGRPVGPPANDDEGVATMNAAIRRKSGRGPRQADGSHDHHETGPEDSGLLAPAVDPEAARSALIAAARAARFRDPMDAVRLLADQVAPDGSNAADLVAALAKAKPYYAAIPSWGSADQGARGTAPAPVDNAAMNTWLRDRRDAGQTQRGVDAGSLDGRIREAGR